jgi:hypothetical protein
MTQAASVKADDGECDVGRIFRQADGQCFWSLSFQLTGHKSCGRAASLGAAKPAFKAEYEAWRSGYPGNGPGAHQGYLTSSPP